jgi:tryptophan-rich hypothetical protein
LHKINPKKLLHSKWTAMEPKNKEKHFMVTELELNEDGSVSSCSIEALMSKRLIPIQWQELKDGNLWQLGWK